MNKRISTAALAALCWHCGSEPPPPPPPPPTTAAQINADDPCADGAFPTPTDLFVAEDGTSEAASCPTDPNPIEAAIELARRVDGAAAEAEISIPLDGTLDPVSLNSTAAFSLSGSVVNGLPPVIVMERTGTSTGADAWELVDVTPSYDGSAIKLRRSGSWAFGSLAVAVATKALKDAEPVSKPLVTSPAVAALLGDSPVAAGTGISADAAPRLERTRLQLQGALAVLNDVGLSNDDIVAIQGFSVEEGPLRMARAADKYYASVTEGRYGFENSTVVVGFSEVYPGLPPAAYENVAEFRRGSIKAPKFLNDEGTLRDGFEKIKEEIDIPITVSVPARAQEFGVVVFLPGFGRAAIDGRSLANLMSAPGSSAVLSLDMRCHGARSPGADGVCVEDRNAQEVMALTDSEPNNGNPELAAGMPDGLPDDSGIGFFPGTPRQLRDSQIAAALELLHVLQALRTRNTFDSPINVDRSQIHVIAQGHMAPVAIAALAHAQFPLVTLTLQFPSGGIGYRELVLNGPEDLKAAFSDSLPDGVLEGDLDAYFSRLEDTILKGLPIEDWAEQLQTDLRQGTRYRVLLPHSAVTDFVSEKARQDLVDAFALPSSRVCRHPPACDDYLLYTCTLGQAPTWLDDARLQPARFVASNGETISQPCN